MNSKKENGRVKNGPKLKIGYCCLPPERVELTLNSKKETSKWAKSQDALLWLKSAVKTIESKWAKRSQLGRGLSWAWPILTRSQIGPRSQDRSEHKHRLV